MVPVLPSVNRNDMVPATIGLIGVHGLALNAGPVVR